MQLQVISRRRLDTAAYDTCLAAAPNQLLYGLSWWLDAVSPGWACVVWAEAGRYRAVLPLPLQRRYGVPLIHQPFFCQFLDIFSEEMLSAEQKDAFFGAVRQHCRWVASLCLITPPTPLSGETVQQRHTHVIRLSTTPEALHRAYNRDRRLNLKRALQANWTATKGYEISTLGHFFRENHAARLPGGHAPPRAYALLERLFAETEKRGLSELWYATRNGQPEAGCWLVSWAGRTFYLFNAATPAGRQGNARTFLLDRYLTAHAHSGHLFDFESATEPAVADFYASFGSQPLAYYHWSYERLPLWLRKAWRIRKSLKIQSA